MNNLKRFLSALLAVVTMLVISVPAFAAVNDTGFSDVAADAWYADAVRYVRDNGLMSGTSATTFDPEAATSRAMLATILYRVSGSPAVTTSAGFADVADGAYYADAVNWAAANNIVSGYGNGSFGTNDPITREQIATILWRYAGSPSADQGQAFSDESAIASYAAGAVDWVRANGIMNGMTGNRFEPDSNATRAQVASIFYNYMTMASNVPNTPTTRGETLVVYFSGSGNTEAVAKTIADTLTADVFEITPADPYTSADLNWTEPSSRVNAEHENVSMRAVELTSTTVDNWDSYDTVLIGYPIWWGIAAWPVDTFVKANDFTGKTVIPFCTSTSSGLGESGKLLAEMAGTGEWLDGQRFTENSSVETVTAWVSGLNLNTDHTQEQNSRALVAYFSMPETSNPENMTTEEANSTVVIDGEVLGNTQYMAYVIQKQTGADVFRIEPQIPYPTNHETLVDQAAVEQDANFRPVLKNTVENLNDYNVIYLGYPNWWGDMPMILYSFLEQHDLSGKTIIPFNTHGGSGFSGTINSIRELEPEARVLDGLTISRNHIQDAEQEIIDWVNDLNTQ